MWGKCDIAGIMGMRGMHSKESAQKIIEAMRIHYNYCREHSQLGKTPSEQAGIKLDLKDNKVESLIRLAATKSVGDVTS